MQSGELDATLLYLTAGNLVDRSTIDLTKDPNVRRLFPDQKAEGIAATGRVEYAHAEAPLADQQHKTEREEP